MINLKAALDEYLMQTQAERDYHRDSYKVNQKLVKDIYSLKRDIERLEAAETNFKTAQLSETNRN